MIISLIMRLCNFELNTETCEMEAMISLLHHIHPCLWVITGEGRKGEVDMADRSDEANRVYQLMRDEVEFEVLPMHSVQIERCGSEVPVFQVRLIDQVSRRTR